MNLFSLETRYHSDIVVTWLHMPRKNLFYLLLEVQKLSIQNKKT